MHPSSRRVTDFLPRGERTPLRNDPAPRGDDGGVGPAWSRPSRHGSRSHRHSLYTTNRQYTPHMSAAHTPGSGLHTGRRGHQTQTDRCNRSRHRATALHPILQSRTQARASTHSARGRNLHPAHFYTPPSYSPHTHASPRLNSRRPQARIASPSAARHVGADASAIRTPRVGPSCAYCTPCTALMGSLHSRT